MVMTYIQAVSIGFTDVGCHAVGDGSLYEQLVWDSGSQIPTKEILDVWIAANPDRAINGIVLTKFEFRKLFTMTERVAVDNVQNNTTIPAEYRAILLTMAKDMELSAEIHLGNADVIDGVRLLETLGLLATGRANQIINNQAPV